MSYSYIASDTYWRAFYALPPDQKESVRTAWKIFKIDPFDTRLGTHKINSLSARAKRTVYSVIIESDLRVVFYIDGNWVKTIDMGDHSIYN